MEGPICTQRKTSFATFSGDFGRKIPEGKCGVRRIAEMADEHQDNPGPSKSPTKKAPPSARDYREALALCRQH